jgi:hypothetical protein
MSFNSRASRSAKRVEDGSVPCFSDLKDEDFSPIRAAERTLVEAIVARAPDELAPVLTQLNAATTCDPGDGWLVFRGTGGQPCRWPEGRPYDITVPDGLGPQGCYSIMLWFNREGQLHTIEFLMLENGRLNLEALTMWLLNVTP